MTWAVRFEDVGKRFPRGGPQRSSLREDLARLIRRPLGSLGNGGRPTGVTALDGVSFEVDAGESFALIGPNGAGKTTALKLLARISHPTRGRVRLRGRVGALIEVGAGIHPELTGRENIWLFGRIMGMSGREIRRRFFDIVEFAELGHVLDTPSKMYSSGMQLRLGFAIASHIEPDIFVVDEALAVGDAGFQAKCVERMTTLLREGRTLLFVSHNLSAVETICRRGLFLLDGRIEALGATPEVLRRYLDWVDTRQLDRIGREVLSRPSRHLQVLGVSFHDRSGAPRGVFRTGDDLEIRLTVTADTRVPRPFFSLGITDGRPGSLILCSMLVDGRVPEAIEGPTTLACRIEAIPLLPRVYQVWCSVRSSHAYGDIFDGQIVGAFRVAEAPAGLNGPGAIAHTTADAPIFAKYEWVWERHADLLRR